MNYRVTRNQNYLYKIVSKSKEYIDNEIISKEIFSRKERKICEIIDGGAFDVDSVDTFLDEIEGVRLSIHCYEPEHKNAERIREKIMRWHPHEIVVHECGLYISSKQRKGFLGGGLGGSIADDSEKVDYQIKTEAIDDVAWNNLCMIKLNIEGMEQYALQGGISAIKEQRPILSICAYHRQDDIIKLSDFMFQLKNYKVYLRHYMNATSETIIYGIPEEYSK